MKRFISMMVVVLLLLSLVPALVFAAENPVPKAKQAVVMVYSGIYYDRGSMRVLDSEGYYSRGTAFGVYSEGDGALVFATNAHVAGAKYAQLARNCGMGGTADTIAVRNLRNNLVRLRRELKLPETLAQAGIAPGALRSATNEIVKATLDDPCCRTNPMKIEDFLVRRILEEVTGRV